MGSEIDENPTAWMLGLSRNLTKGGTDGLDIRSMTRVCKIWGTGTEEQVLAENMG